MQDVKLTPSCRDEVPISVAAYLIFGEKTALVDASHEKFSDLFMSTLEQELKAAGRAKIDYIFVSHTEPGGQP